MGDNDIQKDGKADIVFLDGLGRAIEGIVYRLSTKNQIFLGISDAKGQAKPVTISNAPSNLPVENHVVSDKSASVGIEVQRDDCTWKFIGSFSLESGTLKRVCAATDTFKMPIYLTRDGMGSPSAPVPFHGGSLELPSAESVTTAVTLVLRYWIAVKLTMVETDIKAAKSNPSAWNLPYIVVKRDEKATDRWIVLPVVIPAAATSVVFASDSAALDAFAASAETTARTIKDSQTVFGFPGIGDYRVYAKEPGGQFELGKPFPIPHHSDADDNQGPEVMPFFAFKVEDEPDEKFKITYGVLDDLFDRGVGGQFGYFSPLNSTKIAPKNEMTSHGRALVLGEYRITPTLWGDVMPAYGTDYLNRYADKSRMPGDIKAALEEIYKEALKANDDPASNKELKPLIYKPDTNPPHIPITIKFDNMATDGGHTYALSFTSVGAVPPRNMSRSETLRRTHPSVFAWLLKAMVEIGATGAIITGAWRPHTGEVRHRYSVALDVTHLKKANVVIHFNIAKKKNANGQEVFRDPEGPQANPTATEPNDKTSMEHSRWEFSRKFFKYVATEKQAGNLAWLGGPWVVCLTENGELSSDRSKGKLIVDVDNPRNPNAPHIHQTHVHLSIGTDQL